MISGLRLFLKQRSTASGRLALTFDRLHHVRPKRYGMQPLGRQKLNFGNICDTIYAMFEVVVYETEDRRAPFEDWFNALDTQAALKVTTAIARIEAGNLGDVKPAGQGSPSAELPLDLGIGSISVETTRRSWCFRLAGPRNGNPRTWSRPGHSGRTASRERKEADDATHSRFQRYGKGAR